MEYILVAIDILSRYAFAEPLHSKTGPEVARGFKRIFAKGRVPRTIRTDRASEFKSEPVQNLFKEKGIFHYLTEDTPKANYIEL